MPTHWLFILALTTVGALVVLGRAKAPLAKRKRSSAWAAFWSEYYRPGHHKVGVVLGGTHYVGTVEAVDEVVATGNVRLENVTIHDEAGSARVKLDAPVYLTEDQQFYVYLVDA